MMTTTTMSMTNTVSIITVGSVPADIIIITIMRRLVRQRSME